MIDQTPRISRRAVLSGAAAITAVATFPARAQTPPIKLGTLNEGALS